jgi:predicted O-methyltransferase YrrM
MENLLPPETDPTPIFELYRASYTSELLIAAVAHFDLFRKLASGPGRRADLQAALGLADRPMVVLTCGLQAMGLLVADGNRLQLSPLAREHLLPGGAHYVGDYISLVADKPGVVGLVERLRTNRPADAKAGDATAWIYKDGSRSAMDAGDTARHFTLALAGRAKNVAPALAEKVSLAGANLLLDIGGGTGLYSIAWLQRFPRLKAVILDRPEVLKIAAEMAERYGVQDRLELLAGDLFETAFPTDADVYLLSNILHDWDIPDCERIVRRCAAQLPRGGKFVILEAFLNDDFSGPLATALYSTMLFCVTEGRAYTRREIVGWLSAAGLTCREEHSLLVNCAALVATHA